MKKLTDKELDSLFKEAAEGYQPPFDAASWEAMADKLDQPVKRFAWPRWLTFSLIGVFIFLTGMWVGISIHNGNNSSSKKESIREAQLSNDSQIPAVVKSDDSILTKAESTATSASRNSIDQEQLQEYDPEKSVKEILSASEIDNESQLFITKDEKNEFVQTVQILNDSSTEMGNQRVEKTVFSKSDSFEVVQELKVKQVPDSVLSGMCEKESGN